MAKRYGPIVRALSVRQPWVELILCGKKRAEYRRRPTNIRERVYLYASLQPADWPSAWRAVDAEPGELPTGRVIGSVEIVNCEWDAEQDCYAYLLRAPSRLSRALVPVNQPQPGFWRPQFRRSRV
jgi:hypothetical protein